MSKDTLSFPNILTILRFLLSTLVFFLLLNKRTLLAIALFILVAFTDMADGWFARNMRKKSSFGEMLDPMADKFMVFLALIALLSQYNFPPYGIIIVVRDVISLIGSLIIFITAKKNWKPNIFGKATTFLQVLTIISYIVNLEIKEYILWITIVVSILAATTYFIRGIGLITKLKISSN
ncbi:MAG: CDP-alcohol phosphatidyltransferase family protein [Nanoarchaeota archaeon]